MKKRFRIMWGRMADPNGPKKGEFVFKGNYITLFELKFNDSFVAHGIVLESINY